MAKCEGCGTTEARRTRLTVADRFNVRKEICNVCQPEEFADKFADPSDRKVWDEAAARPHLYKTFSDGSIRAKDELLADMEEAMNADIDKVEREAAIERKRKNRRTTPMTKLEMEQSERSWRPLVEQMKREHELAHKEHAMQLEAIVEKYVGNRA